ncbi:hypothetical protein FRB91_008313 [Serendipita sp. 411]|nr:hypothetical protein FRB91_008313 [Serendipita sp. 411]
MPPKLNQHLDPKSRKMTDFFLVKNDPNDSSQSTLSTSSPRRGTAVNSASASWSHLTPQSIFPDPGTLSKSPSKVFGSSPLKPSVSPRKFIVIEDDEDEDADKKEMESAVPKPRKRPREMPTDLHASTKDNVSGGPKSSAKPLRTVIDLTLSPPRKKRSVDVPESSSPGSSTHVSSKPLHRPTASTGSSLMDYSVATSHEEEAMLLHETDFADESQKPPSSSHSVPSSSLQSIAEDPDASNDTAFKNSTRARIEALKKKAAAAVQLRNSEETSKPGIVAQINMDDSEEEDDVLDKIFAPKAKLGPSVSGSQLPPKGLGGPEVNRNLFESTSPLTSENENAFPIIRRNPARTSRAGSVAPSLPPARTTTKSRTSRAPSAVPDSSTSRVKASKKKTKIKEPKEPPAPTFNNMPSSLASLLGGPRAQSNGTSDPTRQAMLQSAERYLKEIEKGIELNMEQGDTAATAKEVDHTVTEMALGAEGAQKMKQIFAVDSTAAMDTFPWRPLWDDQLIGASGIVADYDSRLPALETQGSSHPILSILEQCVESNDATRLLWIFRGGLILSLPPPVISRHILPWLFTLACSFGTREDLATTSIHIISKIIQATDWKQDRFPLTFIHLLSPILSLGPLTSVVSIFNVSDVAITPPPDPITRNTILGRIVSVIQSMSRLNAPIPNPRELLILCLLLYLEPSTPNYTRRDLSLFLDEMIDSISANGSWYERDIQLALCKHVVDAASEFRVIEKHEILRCLFGGRAASRDFRRWVAIGLLRSTIVESLESPQFARPPSLAPLVDLLDMKSKSSPLKISATTDYGDLFHHIEIIGIVLTDIRIYDDQAANMDKILSELESLHGSIDDARAAFLDRTRAKDAIQRMRLRVLYQFHHKTKTTIDSMFQR